MLKYPTDFTDAGSLLDDLLDNPPGFADDGEREALPHRPRGLVNLVSLVPASILDAEAGVGNDGLRVAVVGPVAKRAVQDYLQSAIVGIMSCEEPAQCLGCPNLIRKGSQHVQFIIDGQRFDFEPFCLAEQYPVKRYKWLAAFSPATTNATDRVFRRIEAKCVGYFSGNELSGVSHRLHADRS